MGYGWCRGTARCAAAPEKSAWVSHLADRPGRSAIWFGPLPDAAAGFTDGATAIGAATPFRRELTQVGEADASVRRIRTQLQQASVTSGRATRRAQTTPQPSAALYAARSFGSSRDCAHTRDVYAIARCEASRVPATTTQTHACSDRSRSVHMKTDEKCSTIAGVRAIARGAAGHGRLISSQLCVARIDRVTHDLAEQVAGAHAEKQQRAGKDGKPPRMDVIAHVIE